MYLFKSIGYKLSIQEIEYLNDPGIATTILELLTYSDDFSKLEGLNQLWYKNTTTDAETDDTGFAGNYNKIVYGFKHELTLVRDSDANTVLRAAGVDPATILLHKLSWFVSRVVPSDEYKMKLYQTIQSKTKFNCGFHRRQCDSISVPHNNIDIAWRLSAKSEREKPRYSIVSFQTEKTNNQEENAAVFDHCRLKNIYNTLTA